MLIRDACILGIRTDTNSTSIYAYTENSVISLLDFDYYGSLMDVYDFIKKNIGLSFSFEDSDDLFKVKATAVDSEIEFYAVVSETKSDETTLIDIYDSKTFKFTKNKIDIRQDNKHLIIESVESMFEVEGKQTGYDGLDLSIFIHKFKDHYIILILNEVQFLVLKSSNVRIDNTFGISLY